ncbi:MAG: hypothetical protein M3450_06470 [Actinomycetota bacterium]|nr:hypothetical protein [Actinomycetota bacterium]
MTAGVIALGITTAPTSAETAVGAEAGVAVGDHSIDAGLVHVLESTLDSQFVGVEVALVRGRLVLSGFATPGVHTAVLANVANVLQNPIPVPVGVGVASPDLGLDLPFLGAVAGVELPDLSRVLRLLGVVDRIQIIR